MLIDIYNEAKNINKMSSYEEYNYEYLKQIVVDEELNAKYGNSRNGFEKYRKELGVRTLNHTGEVSLRTSEQNGDIIGYVLERKTNRHPSHELMKPLVSKAFDAFCEELSVVDKETVQLWMESEYIENDFHLIKFLKDTQERYSNDEDFKKIFDKIKG